MICVFDGLLKMCSGTRETYAEDCSTKTNATKLDFILSVNPCEFLHTSAHFMFSISSNFHMLRVKIFNALAFLVTFSALAEHNINNHELLFTFVYRIKANKLSNISKRINR